MRNIINISLPDEMVKKVKKEVKSGNFATTSEFFRHLIRLWNTYELAEEIKKRREEVKTGKVRPKVLRSLRDLR